MLPDDLSDLILGIDHVALTVTDIDFTLPVYSALEFTLLDHSEVHREHSGALYATLKNRDATLVLVQGTSPTSQVSQFVEQFGASMHHVAFALADLDEALRCTGKAGITLDTPVVSDTGIRQTFLHRDERTGVCIELFERRDAQFSEHNIEQLFLALEAIRRRWATTRETACCSAFNRGCKKFCVNGH